MTKVVIIYEAKTNLSRLIKKAEAGETGYIGAYKDEDLINPDLELAEQIEDNPLFPNSLCAC